MMRIHKKGMLDDFFDLLFLLIGLFLGIFLISFALTNSVSSANEKTLQHLAINNAVTTLQQYLQYPVNYKNQEVTMHELILYAYNTDNNDLFVEKTKEFLSKNDLEGSIWVKNLAESGPARLHYSNLNAFTSTSPPVNIIIINPQSNYPNKSLEVAYYAKQEE